MFKENEFRDFDLNLLVVFHALHQEGSVTRAAERLFLGPSAVSMSLKRLRVLFHDELFVREGARMAPTPKAQRIAPAIAAVLESSLGLVNDGASFDPARLERAFRVGTLETFERCIVPDLYVELRRVAPRTTLVTRTADYLNVAALLDSGEADVAVGVFRDMQPWHRVELLGRRGFRCAYSKSQLRVKPPIGMDTFLKHGHLLYSHKGDLHGAVDEQLARLGKKRNVVAATERWSAFPAWLRRAPLIATMPDYLATELETEPDIASSALPFSMPPFDVSMAWHRRLDDDPASVWFRDLIRRVTGEVRARRAAKAVRRPQRKKKRARGAAA